MKIDISKGYRAGCIGRITQLHSSYYHRNNGFGLYFEAKVASEIADFMQRYNDESDGIWLAIVDGEVEGAIAIDGAHANEEGAHLRWFIVSDRMRGNGCGNLLLQTAVNYCKSKSFRKIFLWTFEGLTSARHLYEKHGFRLVHERNGVQWGSEVNEQRFELCGSPSSNWLFNTDA